MWRTHTPGSNAGLGCYTVELDTILAICVYIKIVVYVMCLCYAFMFKKNTIGSYVIIRFFFLRACIFGFHQNSLNTDDHS